jgi:hypothetical protein
MSHAARTESEAHLFIFRWPGEMKQLRRLIQKAADWPRLLADLLRRYALERWHEQRLITEGQVAGWIAPSLALLLPAEGYHTT